MAVYMYVSLQQEDRIDQYEIDPATGGLEWRAGFALAGMPAPLAVDPQKRFLFAGLRRPGAFGLSSFGIEPGAGALTLLSSVDVAGDPVHVSTDRTGNYLLSAYYYQARVGGARFRRRRRAQRVAHRVAGDGHRRPLRADRPLQPLCLRSAHRRGVAYGAERHFPVPV